MTEQQSIYDVTSPPIYHHKSVTIEGLAAAFASWTDVRRKTLLRELAELERSLGFGKKGKPTTSKLRSMWQQWRGRCPHCGKELEK